MDEKGKRKILKFVDLPIHVHDPQTGQCSQCCCDVALCKQLDPTKPEDMAKIWEAFREHKDYDELIIKVFEDRMGLLEWRWLIANLFSDSELKAKVLLDFIENKENK